MTAVVEKNTCTGCGACVDVCPVEAIKVNGVADISDACVDCGQCVDACPVKAITLK